VALKYWKIEDDLGAEVDSLILQLTEQVVEVAHFLLSH
jgi:hypothetical protein